MRDSSRFRHCAGSRSDRGRCLFQRRSGRRAHRKAAAALQAAAEGSSGRRARERRGGACDDRPAIAAPSYVIAAPGEDTDEEITEFNPVIIAEIDDGAEAHVGQRRCHAARSDRHRGGGVSARWTRPRQSGLSPRRRPYRLDRSAGRQRSRTAIDGPSPAPYGPPPLARTLEHLDGRRIRFARTSHRVK